MLKLYTSKEHPNHWIACVAGTGWVAFPKTENGWEKRHPARGLDPIHLRQIPLQMAENTGITRSEQSQLALA